MKTSSRRSFMLHVVAAGTALSVARAHAQGKGPKVDENEPQPAALGYKQDTSKVDAKKYPNHAASQRCTNCQLFQGKATDPTGGCPLFAGKQVVANAWCSAWAKKV